MEKLIVLADVACYLLEHPDAPHNFKPILDKDKVPCPTNCIDFNLVPHVNNKIVPCHKDKIPTPLPINEDTPKAANSSTKFKLEPEISKWSQLFTKQLTTTDVSVLHKKMVVPKKSAGKLPKCEITKVLTFIDEEGESWEIGVKYDKYNKNINFTKKWIKFLRKKNPKEGDVLRVYMYDRHMGGKPLYGISLERM